MKANSKNRSGQSIQIGESSFMAFFRFAALLCPFLRWLINGVKVGWRYLTRFGTALSVRLLLFGFCFK